MPFQKQRQNAREGTPAHDPFEHLKRQKFWMCNVLKETKMTARYRHSALLVVLLVIAVSVTLTVPAAEGQLTSTNS